MHSPLNVKIGKDKASNLYFFIFLLNNTYTTYETYTALLQVFFNTTIITLQSSN
jgi:hypothetical protein